MKHALDTTHFALQSSIPKRSIHENQQIPDRFDHKDPKTGRSTDGFHEGKITVVAAMELQIRGVSKTYPNGVDALKDVTLTSPAGMYGLLGPNGAGKSTLMRILATLQEADSGSVTPGALDVLRRKDEVRKTLG
jgi:ABC-type transport system involved in cytochrome bd biosynthesis fused ATPase/permease subunit